MSTMYQERTGSHKVAPGKDWIANKVTRKGLDLKVLNNVPGENWITYQMSSELALKILHIMHQERTGSCCARKGLDCQQKNVPGMNWMDHIR